MNIGKILKTVQFNLLRQHGIAVTPEQVGLKTDDFPSSFANYLKTNSATLPEPPTPPEDPSDLEAQKKFNEELLAYNQQMHSYNQNMFRSMMMQFQQLQRQASRQSSASSSSGSSSSIGSSTLDVGGII